MGFNPRDYGLKPNASSTACWRGYWCDYVIRRGRLILKNLLIYNADGYYPPFNGIEPSSIEFADKFDSSVNDGHVLYRVNLEMDYTGAIVVGHGFINKYYLHGGFQRAWAFEEVKELVFEKGNLIEVKDHSNEVKVIRGLYDEDPIKFQDDLTYDLSYDERKTNTGIKFDLKAANGEVIATSEVYKSKAACLNGINSVKINASVAAFEDQTKDDFEKCKNPKFEMYLDKAGEHRFRLKAKNGQIIATSEGYKARKSCLNGIESVRTNSASEVIEEE